MPTFKVSDLMINVVDRRLKANLGGAGLCSIDQPTQDNCGLASPYMQVAKISPKIQLTRKLTAVGTRESVDAAIAIAHEIGEVLVAGAAQGGTSMPDPNCGGSSLETIPTPLTPVIHKADLLRVAELPSIREHLKEALVTVEKLEAAHAPRAGAEVEVLRERLGAAVKSLG